MFLRSVFYDQLVMRGENGIPKVYEFTGERVDCDFWDRHFLGEGVGVGSEKEFAKIAMAL